MAPTASEVASLTRSLSHWELAEYVFGGLVAVACTGEFVASFTDWLTGGKEEKKKRLEKLSTLLLITSLTFELICLVKTNQISGRVIGSLDEKAEEATKKSELAIADADSAIGKAQQANEESENAELVAGNAKTLAAGAKAQAIEAGKRVYNVEQQAGDLKKQDEELREKTLELARKLSDAETAELEERKKVVALEELFSPRILRIWVGTKSSFDSLKPFARIKAMFETLKDAEARRAALDIRAVLGLAGWDTADVVVVERPELYTEGFDGVTVEFERSAPTFQEEAAEALKAYLVSNNWQARVRPRLLTEQKIPPDIIKIIVGFKPYPFVDPEWMKQMYEEYRRSTLQKGGRERNLPQSPQK